MSMWAKYGYYCILGMIALIGSLLGTVAYIAHYVASLANREQVTSPIDLAGVTAALGGLILIGAFYKGKDWFATREEKERTKDLKLIGKLVLLSSACFIIAFFLIEYVRLITSPTLSPLDWFFVITADMAIVIAGVSISIALSLLVTLTRFL